MDHSSFRDSPQTLDVIHLRTDNKSHIYSFGPPWLGPATTVFLLVASSWLGSPVFFHPFVFLSPPLPFLVNPERRNAFFFRTFPFPKRRIPPPLFLTDACVCTPPVLQGFKSSTLPEVEGLFLDDTFPRSRRTDGSSSDHLLQAESSNQVFPCPPSLAGPSGLKVRILCFFQKARATQFPQWLFALPFKAGVFVN